MFSLLILDVLCWAMLTTESIKNFNIYVLNILLGQNKISRRRDSSGHLEKLRTTVYKGNFTKKCVIVN